MCSKKKLKNNIDRIINSINNNNTKTIIIIMALIKIIKWNRISFVKCQNCTAMLFLIPNIIELFALIKI